jgi:hypothetical protein
MHDHLLPAKAARASPLRLSGFGTSLATRIAGWIKKAVDYYASATVYEQLSGLSDPELHRRGLSRATLGRDIAEARKRDSA